PEGGDAGEQSSFEGGLAGWGVGGHRHGFSFPSIRAVVAGPRFPGLGLDGSAGLAGQTGVGTLVTRRSAAAARPAVAGEEGSEASASTAPRTWSRARAMASSIAPLARTMSRHRSRSSGDRGLPSTARRSSPSEVAIARITGSV